MARGEIIPKILEILQIQAEATANLLDIFTSGYGESYRKMRRTIKYGVPQFKTDWAFEYRKRQQFYSLLNQLKNQGFISKKKPNNKDKTIWSVTQKGLEKLKLLKKEKLFSVRDVDYPKKREATLKVIIFDIPEKERQKRTWIRAALLNLDFSLLQESVWIGQTAIPQEFLYDLREREMLPYVQIFEINKRGTITKLS